MKRYPLRNWLARFDSRFELDCASGANRILRQPVRQVPDYSHAVKLSLTEQQHLENDDALYPNSSCLACVTGIRFASNLCLNVDFLWLVSNSLILVEKVCERAVVGTSIIFVFLGRYLCSRRQ